MKFLTKKFLKFVVVLVLPQATKGSSEIAAPDPKSLSHSDGAPMNTKSLFHYDGDPDTMSLYSYDGDLDTKSLSHPISRNLDTCSVGWSFNACANCCGYKFTTKAALATAVNNYVTDKAATIITYGLMNCWDASSIDDMSALFAGRTAFDEPIGCWDVSSVTDMSHMFWNATNFNQTIGNWNVSKVTNMYQMFLAAASFNQAVGNWDVSKVTNMQYMFYQATSFNQAVGNWNVSKVDNMYQMFLNAIKFNQAIGNWDVSKVSNMQYMFYQATSFNQNLCAWYNKLKSTTAIFIFDYSGCTYKANPDFSLKNFFCQACTSNNGGVQGDPHFKTWHGDHFSYHGECDLVLLKNDHFSNGLGVLIHVRTKIEKTWSYVKNVAVKIGHDILEIEGKGQVWDKSADAVLSINGEVNAELPFQFAMKFPVTRLKEKQCDTNGAKCIEAIVYKIDLGEGNNILITQKWGVIKVTVTANDKNKFHDTVGLMGHFNKPGFLARDGIQKMTDFNQFGQEWQVLQSEPMIFNERRAPQHPEQCTLPTLTTKRRLGEDSALYQMAEKACAGVEEGSKSFCIFDVTAAGTEEAASTYYTAYVG